MVEEKTVWKIEAGKLIAMANQRMAILDEALDTGNYVEALAELMIVKDLVESLEAVVRRLESIS